MEACKLQDNYNIIKLLLEAGADVNYQMATQQKRYSMIIPMETKGWTALLTASTCNRPEAIQILLEAGADVNMRWVTHANACQVALTYATCTRSMGRPPSLRPQGLGKPHHEVKMARRHDQKAGAVLKWLWDRPTLLTCHGLAVWVTPILAACEALAVPRVGSGINTMLNYPAVDELVEAGANVNLTAKV